MPYLLNPEWSLERVAKSVGISPATLRRYFVHFAADLPRDRSEVLPGALARIERDVLTTLTGAPAALDTSGGRPGWSRRGKVGN